MRVERQQTKAKASAPVDDFAREIAKAALQKIEVHEATCAERWNQVHQTTERIEKNQSEFSSLMTGQISALRSIIWKSAAGLITALIGLIYFLLTKAF